MVEPYAIIKRAKEKQPWPLIVDAVLALPPHALVANIGGESERYAKLRSDIDVTDVDLFPPIQLYSNAVRHLLCSRGSNLWLSLQIVLANQLLLPFKDASFDLALSISVLHHLSSEERRKQALQELLRVTRPRGRVVVLVKALKSAKRTYKQQDSFILKKTGAEKAGKAVKVQVYYHLFRPGEFEGLLVDLAWTSLTPLTYKDHFGVEIVK